MSTTNCNKKRKLPLTEEASDNQPPTKVHITNSDPSHIERFNSDNTTNSKENKPKTIGTHHGKFHCDEVLACYMLINHTKEYRNANLIRSRNDDILSGADIVVDVGAKFDLSSNRFDHHQSSFNEQFSSKFQTKLSSAGLIYKYFGKEIIQDIILNHSSHIQTKMDKIENKENKGINDDLINIIWNKVYKSFIEEIDGIDNGINQYDTTNKALYKIGTHLSSRIDQLNPWWNQQQNDGIAMIQFKKAMKFAGDVLLENVLFIYKGWLPARDIVEMSIKNRFNIDKSGQILKLSQFCPWISHLYEINEVNKIEPFPVYVLFEDIKSGWRIRAVPVAHGSFANIKSLPKPWCGKRNEELDKICNIEGSIFVHASGFIGGNKTYEGALKMAQKALEYRE